MNEESKNINELNEKTEKAVKRENLEKKNALIFIVISSVLCLLPLIFGLIVWKKLPSKMPVHWNFSGSIDRYAPKAVGVFVLPLLCFCLNLFEHITVEIKKKSEGLNYGFMEKFLKWIIPVICIFVSTLSYLASFNVNPTVIKVILISFLILLLLFVTILVLITFRKVKTGK